jgi:2-polyprenyl-3-methyl-5-hydroxy-6-metoxy-1,4-benzoquinol methylase
MDPTARILPQAEMGHYDLHENDIFDIRYRDFVSPIFEQVMHYSNRESKILDFGCGPGPVVSQMLKEAGRQTIQYDPFYCNDTSVFDFKYDVVFACEVAEHFYDPSVEFRRLCEILNPEGYLIIQTLMANQVDFATWNYRMDPTHVVFYSGKSFDWIAKKMKLRIVNIDAPRLVNFQKIA